MVDKMNRLEDVKHCIKSITETTRCEVNTWMHLERVLLQWRKQVQRYEMAFADEFPIETKRYFAAMSSRTESLLEVITEAKASAVTRNNLLKVDHGNLSTVSFHNLVKDVQSSRAVSSQRIQQGLNLLQTKSTAIENVLPNGSSSHQNQRDPVTEQRTDLVHRSGNSGIQDQTPVKLCEEASDGMTRLLTATKDVLSTVSSSVNRIDSTRLRSLILSPTNFDANETNKPNENFCWEPIDHLQNEELTQSNPDAGERSVDVSMDFIDKDDLPSTPPRGSIVPRNSLTDGAAVEQVITFSPEDFVGKLIGYNVEDCGLLDFFYC